jgi:hypothetical protein
VSECVVCKGKGETYYGSGQSDRIGLAIAPCRWCDGTGEQPKLHIKCDIHGNVISPEFIKTFRQTGQR